MSKTFDNVICGSGGSTKAIQLAVCFDAIQRSGFRADAIFATSASSFLALPYALCMMDKAIQESLNITVDDFFELRPINKKGDPTFAAIWRTFLGLIGFKDKHSLGIQNTRHFLKKYIDSAMFEHYKNIDLMPEIGIVRVDMNTGAYEVQYAKQLSFNAFIEVVEMSARIPITTQDVCGGVDGGLWAHNPEWILLKDGIIKPKNLISIYAREPIFQIAYTEKWRKNIGSYTARTMTIMNAALSTSGEAFSQAFCQLNGIVRNTLFCKQILDEMYDFDKDQLIEAMNITCKDVESQMLAWKPFSQ